MFEAFLITTSSEGLRPLGSAAQRSFELVTGTIRDRLGDQHASLFSEPVATAHGDSTDWHAAVAGKPVPLSELNTEEQQQIRQRLGTLAQDILRVSQELAESPAPQDQRLGEALANALEVPGDEMIYVVRDNQDALHPVLVNWSWSRDDQKGVQGLLTGLSPRPKPAFDTSQTASGPVASRGLSGFWWWLLMLGWLLLALFLAAILYLLIEPCGLSRGGIFFCPEPAKSTVVAGGQSQVLEDEVAALERELALQTRMCQPDYAGKEVPVTDEPEVERRLKKTGAKQGDLGFTLIWNSKDDLDLQVICPSDQTIGFRNRSACNGTLDVDANVKVEDAVKDPVENIYFVDPAFGKYDLRVRLSQVRTQKPVSFTLRVTRRDGQTQTYTASVSSAKRDWKKTIGVLE